MHLNQQLLFTFTFKYVFKDMNRISILSFLLPGPKVSALFWFLMIIKPEFTFLSSFLSSCPELELNESIALESYS